MSYLWIVVTVLPLFGWEFTGDRLSASIAYTGLTVGLAILLHKEK